MSTEPNPTPTPQPSTPSAVPASPPPAKPGLAAGVSVKPTLPSVGASAVSGPGLSGAGPATFKPPVGTTRPGVAFQKPKLRTAGASSTVSGDASAHKAPPVAAANANPPGALVALSAISAVVAVAGAILLYLKHTA